MVKEGDSGECWCGCGVKKCVVSVRGVMMGVDYTGASEGGRALYS